MKARRKTAVTVLLLLLWQTAGCATLLHVGKIALHEAAHQGARLVGGALSRTVGALIERDEESDPCEQPGS